MVFWHSPFIRSLTTLFYDKIGYHQNKITKTQIDLGFLSCTVCLRLEPEKDKCKGLMKKYTARKVSKYGGSEYGKIRTRINSVFGHFWILFEIVLESNTKPK